jgi:hypothetical protein
VFCLGVETAEKLNKSRNRRLKTVAGKRAQKDPAIVQIVKMVILACLKGAIVFFDRLGVYLRARQSYDAAAVRTLAFCSLVAYK